MYVCVGWAVCVQGCGYGCVYAACTLMDAFTHQGILFLLAIILPECTSFIVLSFVLFYLLTYLFFIHVFKEQVENVLLTC